MISFVLGLAVVLAVVVLVDFVRWCRMSEKDRFYKNESERYGDLDVGWVKLGDKDVDLKER